jgi:hypothetical protein
MEKEEFNKEVGKYIIDLSKLIFGGVVLASIIKIEDVSRYLILLVGIIISGIAAFWGFQILKIKNKK